MGKIIEPSYEKYIKGNDIVSFWYQGGFSNKVSFGIFGIDFNKKIEYAINLLREYFQTTDLDSISYDIVKSYCLSEYYHLYDEIDIEATDKYFLEFFNSYIKHLEDISRSISVNLSSTIRR